VVPDIPKKNQQIGYDLMYVDIYQWLIARSNEKKR